MKEALLSILRSEKTTTAEFRRAAVALGALLAAEAAALVHLKKAQVTTPLGKATRCSLDGQVHLIPLLRSGIALLGPFLNIFPEARIGVFGIRRDEKTALPKLYYEKFQKISKQDIVFILDPMIATGGSSDLAIQRLFAHKVKATQIKLIAILGSKEGVTTLKKKHPQIEIICAATDPELNAKKYIIPGLGDFGDRLFG